MPGTLQLTRELEEGKQGWKSIPKREEQRQADPCHVCLSGLVEGWSKRHGLR